MRDPEWWIQWDNSPWLNPYARWGTEHMTSLYEERYIRPEFVVSVNTNHPIIRRVLEDGFRKAEDLLSEKASFALEVSHLYILTSPNLSSCVCVCVTVFVFLIVI